MITPQEQLKAWVEWSRRREVPFGSELERLVRDSEAILMELKPREPRKLTPLPEEHQRIHWLPGAPNPGSDEARVQGCRCPVLDNNFGRGCDFADGFVTVEGCLLHWVKEA